MVVFKRLGLMLLLVLAFHFCSVTVIGQMTVKLIFENNLPVKSTKQVRCLRYADFTEQDVKINLVLDTGDELFGQGNVTIELKPSKGRPTSFKFSGDFRFVVVSDHRIDLKAGEVYVQATDPTAVNTGVIMGAAHTEYGVSVRREGNDVMQNFTVFEGDVRILNGPGGKKSEDKVSTGEKLMVTQQAAIKSQIGAADVERGATVNAVADTGKAMMVNRTVNFEETFSLFHNQYVAVLSEPLNADARLNLAITQVNHRETADASYQLAKAEQFAPPNSTLTAKIALTRGVVFTQTGDTAAANMEFQRALAIDPKVFDEGSLTTLKFKPEVKQQIQDWHSAHNVPGGIKKSFETRWPVPQKSSPEQIEIFKLIFARDYDNASRTLRELINRHDSEIDSIDAYAMTILYYERQDMGAAQKAGRDAMEKGKTDGLLTAVEYDAIKRIFEKPH